MRLSDKTKDKIRAAIKKKHAENKTKVLCEMCLKPTEKRLCWEIKIKGPSSRSLMTVPEDLRGMHKYYSCHACYLEAKPTCEEYCKELMIKKVIE